MILPAFLSEAKSRKIQISRLRPQKEIEARQNTLSSRHGLGPLPLHSDFVTEAIPPRYIALCCPVNRSADTMLFEGAAIAEGLGSSAKAALFRVATGHHYFTARFVSQRAADSLYRYNADCMTPLNAAAIKVIDAVSSALPPTVVVDWGSISTIIFDNWRFLHSRGPSRSQNPGWLWRIALWV